MELVAKKKGLYIGDMQDVKTIAKIARYDKWLNRGCIAFSVALGVDKVYETYEDGSVDWIIWAAWADRITFEEIYEKAGYTEKQVIQLMRQQLSERSFKLWRKRVHARGHLKHKRLFQTLRYEERQRRKFKKHNIFT